ncbi:unnamed protein product [Didymodactylos carnosus]|uniref:isopentenyl-diphosphate Delta-isomerase n=1 Tax=Didymodactylos carnosus TaxID=1234261 RepID=A0A814B9E0_9BILA|nr:unnamed protein product [Didymodactylos carnosus]CAF3704778.1 unnamed protein product [Didymodactylos carnosus]
MISNVVKQGVAIDINLNDYDPKQVQLLYEPMIVVDDKDCMLGTATKKDVHLLSNINNGLIHRAFSLFLFNSKTNELLLQQRSPEKITYPNLWTNTCCSHPLYNDQELDGGQGIKHAVIRRVNYELGCDFLTNDDLHYLTRIYYRAENIPNDHLFGECEIDYIVVAFKNFNLLTDLKPNLNEISKIKLMPLEQVEQLNEETITPWFRMIIKSGLLKQWWKSIPNDLTKCIDHTNIHKMA